jgi:HsdM N-terminal domain
MPAPEKTKSLESWIWDAACSIRGAKDAAKYKDYILPLIFTKRLCDVFDDELNRIAKKVGSRKKAFQLAKADHKLVRFYLPLVPDIPEQPVWSVIRKLSDKIGGGVTTQMRVIARENPLLQGIIDRVDFNATTHGQRDLDEDRLSTQPKHLARCGDRLRPAAHYRPWPKAFTAAALNAAPLSLPFPGNPACWTMNTVMMPCWVSMVMLVEKAPP